MLLRKIRTARARGLKWCLLCQLPTLALRIVQKVVRFHPWHADNLPACRPYKRFVADLASSFRPAVAVEVGCGFGDIIAMVDASIRYGLDPDIAAIMTGKALRPFSRARLAVGDLTNLDTIPGHIDVLLLIGWTHTASPEYLQSALRPHLHRIGTIIVDRFADGTGPYRHDFAFIGEMQTVICEVDPVREYLVHHPPLGARWSS